MQKPTDQTIDILIVDDREDGLIVLDALLSEVPNYNLVKARSGAEAIGLLPLYDFGMLLLDVQMPGIDGFETAEIIRKDARFQRIPIIFVTAINKDERYVYRGYEAGAVDYIFKPFDPLILKSKVAVFAELFLQNRLIRQQAAQLNEQEALEHRSYVQRMELENLRRYRNLADSIPHMVLRASADGKLEYHNRQWSAYTGMSLSQSLGTGWHEALDQQNLADVLEVWNKSIHSGDRYEAECRIRRFDGAYRWHWVKAEAERDKEGQVMAWLGTCTDIHDRKIAEQKVIEAQQNAEAANDAKTHFLANMSHEIRTPLNAIIGFTEVLMDPSVSLEEKLKSASIVRRNGTQLLKIVDEILDISKVEAGGLVTEKVETDLPLLLGEIKTLLTVQANKKKIRLGFEMSGAMPAKVMTDSTRLRQILLNILGNAIKFTERGSVELQVRFVTKMEGKSYLYFQVTDTGVGIDAASLKKIFQPFSQADSSTTRLYGGTGLGLALSRRLARALGGDVFLAKSQPGEGSTFLVEIEVGLPVTDRITADDTPKSDGEIQPPANDLPLKGKRILLVEDAEDNQMLIKQFLSRTGALIDFACNGEEGVQKALACEYEVILMDIQMPLIDGYQATRRLRNAGYSRPIIALTAHALVEEREKCLKTGCNGHLTKPISRQQLIESLVQLTT